jgi:hypothetical protein
VLTVGRKFLGNEYEVRGDITAIKLRRKDGDTLEAMIDTDDFEKVKALHVTWYAGHRANRESYVQGHMPPSNGKRKSISLHGFLTDCPDGMVVDHYNHDTLDNRRSNLRVITSGQNGQNRKLLRTNLSGYRGVSWDPKKEKWRAYIRNGDDHMFCGYYKDPYIADRVVSLVRSLIHPYSQDAQEERNKE